MPKIDGKDYNFVYVNVKLKDYIMFSKDVAPFIKYKIKDNGEVKYKKNRDKSINVDKAVSEYFTTEELNAIDDTTLAFCLFSGYLKDNNNTKYNFIEPTFASDANGNSYITNYHETNIDNKTQKFLIDNKGTISKSTPQETKIGYLTKGKVLENWGYAPYCIYEDWNGQKTYHTEIKRIDENTIRIESNALFSGDIRLDSQQSQIIIAQRYLYVDNYKIPRVKNQTYLPSWIANDAKGWKEKDFVNMAKIIEQCKISLPTSEYGYIIGSESGRSIGLVEPTTNLIYTAEIKERIKFFKLNWNKIAIGSSIGFYHESELNTIYFTEIINKEVIKKIQNNFFYSRVKQTIDFPIQREYQINDKEEYVDDTLIINKPKLNSNAQTTDDSEKYINKVPENLYRSNYNINCYSYQWKYKDQPIIWSWCLKYNQPIITLQLSGNLTPFKDNNGLGILKKFPSTTTIDCMHSSINGITKFNNLDHPVTVINTKQSYHLESILDFSNLPYQSIDTWGDIILTFERYPGRLPILYYLYLVGQNPQYQNIYRGKSIAFVYEEIARLYTYDLKDLEVSEIKNKITNTSTNSSYSITYTDAQKEIIATEIYKFFHDTYTIQDFTWDWSRYANGYSKELLQDVLDQLKLFYVSNSQGKVYQFTTDDAPKEITYREIHDYNIQPGNENTKSVAYQNQYMDLETNNTEINSYTQSGSFYMLNQSNSRDGGGVLKYQLSISKNRKYAYAFFRI